MSVGVSRSPPRAQAVGGGWRPPLVLTVALCAVAPMLVIALLAGWRADQLSPLLTIELSNLQATQRLLATLFHPSSRGDSWLPMQQALQVLKGPHRGELYETLFFHGHVRFQYPPTSLLWLEALTAFGRGSVFWLNALNSLVFLANAAAIGLAAWLFLRPTPAVSPPAISPGSRAALSLLAAALAFVFYPLVRAHLLGQIQLWIDLAFTGAVVLWAMDRRLLAGALIGLACTIKPQLGLLLLWGLLWREWRFVGGVVLTLAPVGVLSLLRYGLHDHLAYLGVLSFLSHHGESFFANNSINGLLNWYLAGEDSLHWNEAAFTPYRPLVYLGTVCATLVFLAAVVLPPLLARGRKADLGDLAAAAICTVASSPVAWEHHYGLLAPLFVLALAQLLAQPAGPAHNWRALVLLAAWTLTANFIPFASLAAGTPFVALQAYCFFGALLLLGLFLVRGGARVPVPAET